jgi:hypothetical protein
MGERKVLNKYIPADFDPRLVPRGSKPKDDLIPVRMMLPFTVQCSTCSDFMYRGRKFNSKKEAVKGSEGKYLGLQRWRFYIKCNACSRPVTFLTDPKNGDYEMESGGTRTYEVHKNKKKVMVDVDAGDDKLEKQDPMKALENRVLASQREMADLDNLDEIKAMNMRHLRMDRTTGIDMADLVLKKARNEEDIDEEEDHAFNEDDEALIKSIQFGKQRTKSTGSTFVRLSEKEETELQQRRQQEQKLMEKQQIELLNKIQIKKNTKQLNPMIKVKRKRKSLLDTSEQKRQTAQKKIKAPDEGGALGLLGGYSSDESD